LRKVDVAHVGYVIRLGKRIRRVKEGLCLIIPIIDELKTFNLQEQTRNYEPTDMFTSDRGRVNVNATIFFRILPVLVGKAKEKREKEEQEKEKKEEQGCILDVTPEVLEKGLQDATYDSIRESVAETPLEECLGRKAQIKIRDQATERLEKVAKKWGMKITEVAITDIEVTKEFKESILAEKNEVLKRKGELIKADSDKRTNIIRAEGEAEAIKKRTRGETYRIKEVAKYLGIGKNPSKYFMLEHYWNALESIAKGEGNVTVIPAKLTDFLSAVPMIKSLLGKSGSQSKEA